MIDQRVLNSLISTFDDPSFSVFIKDFQQNNECNKDEIIISLEQVTPNLFKLLQTKEFIIDELIDLLTINNITIPNTIIERNNQHINNVVEKQLIFDSSIAINDDKSVKSEINGYVDILGYGDIYNYIVEGTIKNGIVNVLYPGRPVYIPIDRIKVRKNELKITIPDNIKDIVVKIDDTVITHTISENVISVPFNNLNQGNHTFNISYAIKPDITNQNIEVIVTPIAKTIEIEFQKPHTNIPAIILTVDQKDTNLYSKYITDFVIDEETGKYTGVNLEFKSLRRKASYPNVNICILGE